MVDQAQVTAESQSTELPPQAVARGTAEFLHDVATLAELQGKLVVVDFREGMVKLLMPAMALCLGGIVALGCVPVALVTLAIVLKSTTSLSLSASFGIALLVGVVLSGLLLVCALAALKSKIRIFDRSLYEWGRNMKWIKDTLRRLGQNSPAGHSFHPPARRW
jgi:hypothetical protein